MENLREKLVHEDCDRKSKKEQCKTVYLLLCLAEEISLKEKILEKIKERAEKEYTSEDYAKHKETFVLYGPKDCDNPNKLCHAPYVLRALREEKHISEDEFEQLSAMIDHKYFLSKENGREISLNDASIDWKNSGLAEKFRKEYEQKHWNTKH